MFIDLANSIIRNNSGNIIEGAITTQDTSEQITNSIKEIINGLSEKIELFNQNVPLYQGQVDIIINDINNAIEQKLGNKPVPIVFRKLRPGNYGSYSVDNKVIILNYNKYLVDKIEETQQGTPEEDQRLYKLKDVNNINFDELDETISHELIHQQQDERSGGKYFNYDKSLATIIKKYDTNKNGKLEPDEFNKIIDKDRNTYNKTYNKEYLQKFGEILLNKKIREKFEKSYKDVVPSAAPEDIRKEFTKRVEYLNNKAELNTWAKDIVQQYVRDNYNIIINKAKQDKPPSNLSADDIRNTMLAPFINAADTNVFKNQPQQESVQPSQYQQPVQNTQQQQPVQQQQQPVQQQQQPQKNQELRNKLQQNKNNRDQQQKPTLTQGIKDEQTRILLSYFPEYYLLTSPNKQKWWNYTYQILNKIKFKPFITGQ